ncbi:MAG: DUF1622 domain-containing protein [Planctomycetota bacterium]|jgi:uncharacterized membrane protein
MDKIIPFLNALVGDICQLLAVLVISVGIAKSITIFVKDALFGADSAGAIQESRLELGHAFSLGLGFLIGASILKTAFAPSWDDIGKLAAIIAIRTGLNYFLLKDIDLSTRKPASPSPIIRWVRGHTGRKTQREQSTDEQGQD